MISCIVLNHAFLVLIASLAAIIFKKLRQEKFFIIITVASLALLLLNPAEQTAVLGFKIGDYSLRLKPADQQELVLSLAILICFFCQILFYRPSNQLKLLLPLSGIICACALVIIQVEHMMISLIFIELAAISSTILIFSENNQKSFRLGMRYLLIHIFSASILIMGIVLKYSVADLPLKEAQVMLDDLVNLSALDSNKIAQLLILTALLIDAGTFPFSNWMVESYSATHPYIATTLSAYISKIVLVLIAKTFMGSEILIYIGMASMFYSGMLSLATGNLRQILSYNQIGKFGLMITLIGIGGSIQSVILYMLSYFMISGLILFLVIGKIKLDHGTDALNEVLFYNRKSMIFLIFGIMSALSFPLTGGYFAKVMVNQMLLLQPKLYIPVTILLIPQLIALCKFFLPYFRIRDLILSEEDEWDKSQFFSLIILSFTILVSGLVFYRLFYFPQDFFVMVADLHALIGFLITLLTVLLFIYLTRKMLIRENVIILDVDWFIRKPCNYLVNALSSTGQTLGNKILTILTRGDRILRLCCKGLMGRNRSLYFVIDGFVFTLFVLFVILFL